MPSEPRPLPDPDTACEPRRIDVALGKRSYPIWVGAGLLDRAGERLGPLLALPRVLLVTDETLIATGHVERLERSLTAAGIALHRLVVPAGERSKSMTVLGDLLERMLALGVERKMTVIALGGGVIGDLAGFAAAVLLRGVDFVQIPTTLLAQVDSAVGGKTGINARAGKNLIGAFHQPRAVLIDTSVLDTLPRRELGAGYAEVVKYGCILDLSFFEWLQTGAAGLLAGDEEARVWAICRSLEIKAEVVAQDEHETTGHRALLNFGHTFAHAYENIAGYGGTLLHGEAVSVGTVQAARLSAALGHAPEGDAERLRAHLDSLGMPTEPRHLREEGFKADAVLEAMSRDKKVEGGRLTFVLWRGIGRAFVDRTVPIDALEALLIEHDRVG